VPKEFIAAVALLTGCSIMSGQPASQALNDVAMTVLVKGWLIGAEGLRTLTGVHVHTDRNVVFLTGQTPDATARQRIEALVRHVAGRNRVQNQLTIEGPTEAAAAAAR
jgi:osmotically-inducible protein OsmY